LIDRKDFAAVTEAVSIVVITGASRGIGRAMAEAIAFLATTKGRFIHGHDLTVERGFSIH
jgi:NAD(P)-dependent dehydrogenase (short-subunit alcohol dehydrogenase family)